MKLTTLSLLVLILGMTYKQSNAQWQLCGNFPSWAIAHNNASIFAGGVSSDKTGIFVSNDSYERDYLYINQKDGTFKDEMEDWFGHTSFSSMGADISDINNDGFPEIFTKLRDEGEDHDPLSLLITFFRRGAPLLMLLERVPGLGNLDYLTELWYIDSQKLPKVATYKFIEACIHDLGFQPDECFSIGDLMGSNSTGFVNVRVIFSIRYRCYGSDCII